MKASYDAPYYKEKSDCEESIGELNQRDQELNFLIHRHLMDIDRLRQECGILRKELEMEAQNKIEDICIEKENLEEELRVLNALIEKRKGSFAEWLESNKPDWQDSIGKIANEEAVLYNNGLNPRLTDNSGTLFGVSLNLSAIEQNIRTPEDLKQERLAKQHILQESNNQLVHLSEELNSEIERLEKKYSKLVREIADKQHLLEAERMQLPTKLKNLQVALSSWRTKEGEWKRIRTEEIQEALNEIAHRLYRIEEEKKKIVDERERRLKACQKNYKEQKTGLQKELEQYVSNIKSEINLRKQQLEERKKELRQAQETELGGKGADTVTIRKYDARIEQIQKELVYIREHRSQVTNYEKDKQELFDKEPFMRSCKKDLED